MITHRRFVALALALSAVAPLAAMAAVDTGVIRLGGERIDDSTLSAPETEPQSQAESWSGRRGFDYEAFEQRLESLWFRRKALLNKGRTEDARQQSELIKSFCAEEGVRQLEPLAGALLVESWRYRQEGAYANSLASLDLAEELDPGRPQVHFGRASVLWASGERRLEAAAELARGIRAAVARGWMSLGLANRLSFALVIALLGSVVVFAVLMAWKYNVPFRHETEEWMGRRGIESWAPTAGWALFLLPLWTWFFVGWAVFYWIVITFRFMRRGERIAAVLLLAASSLAVPCFSLSVAFYGMLTDPVVRTVLDSAKGSYSPDRIVKLKDLVDSHPEDPVYRFLLAGLYKDGRYFEEAYRQYRDVLDKAPDNYQAHINIGNIYYRLGQYGEAIAEYGQAIDIRPDSVLAYYNTYVAQLAFPRLRESQETQRTARAINPELWRRLLERGRDEENRSGVRDATIHVGAVWRAALEGRPLRDGLDQESSSGVWALVPLQLVNVFSLAAISTVVACGVAWGLARGQVPARRCIRCGRPFCDMCRSGGRGQEYCSQCLHLFVIGDGLAPETKTRKLYEVERFERLSRRGRRILSLLVPGAGHLLRGRAGRGCVLVFLWLTSLVTWYPAALEPLKQAGGLDLRLDVLQQGIVPSVYLVEPAVLAAVLAVAMIWLAGNTWLWTRREV